MANFMKNSELNKFRENLRIKYGNKSFIQWGKMKSLNEYPEFIYKEIGRELNIVIRYLEDLDAIFTETDELTDVEVIYTVNYLNSLFWWNMNPMPDEMIKDTYYLVSKLTELRAWYKRLNSNLDHHLENLKK